MKKLLALFLAVLILAVPVLSGCGCNKATDTPEEGAETSTGVVLSPGSAVSIGDIELNTDEFNVYLRMGVYDVQNESGAAEGWEEFLCSTGLTARDTAIEYGIEYAQMYVGAYAAAKEAGIYTDADEAEFIATFTQELGGEEEIAFILEENNFSDGAFRKYMAHVGGYEALARYEAEKVFASDAMTAQHVLIMFGEDGSEDAALETATNVYNLAIAGEDFDSLIEQYNEDPGQVPGGAYTFADGEMVAEFYEGTKALEIGGISEPIRTDYGYHVIKRLDLISEDSETYETEIMEILQSNPATYNNFTAAVSEYAVVRNEDLIRQIDMSVYTMAE